MFCRVLVVAGWKPKQIKSCGASGASLCPSPVPCPMSRAIRSLSVLILSWKRSPPPAEMKERGNPLNDVERSNQAGEMHAFVSAAVAQGMRHLQSDLSPEVNLGGSRLF